MIPHHGHAGKRPWCNPNGFAWTACGKPLVSKHKAGGTQTSGERCAEATATRFPTGYAGPWKTLAPVRRRQDDGMIAQANLQQITTTGFPQPLSCQRGLTTTTTGGVPFSTDKRLQSRTFAEATGCKGTWSALVPSKKPRNDFSAWAFLIVANVHF